MNFSIKGAFSIFILLGFLGGASAHGQENVVRVFNADSLTGYMRDLSQKFEAAHPGVEVHAEASGSLDAIRKVTDLNLPCDLLVSADWRLLTKPLKRVEPWVVIFAGNSMGLLYTDRSKGAGEINQSNWFDVITKPGVRYSHSNPERDPAGYWTLIVWQLAADYYKQPGLPAKLAAGLPQSAIRAKSIDLIPLLESGELDYYFGYASDARLGKLRFLPFPAAINLGDIAMRREYAKASVEVGAKKVAGAPIAYGATLIDDGPNQAKAIELLSMMLNSTGRQIASAAGLEALETALGVDPEHRMPAEIGKMTKPLE